MSDIDQISQILGRLEGDAESARNQRDTLFKLLNEVNKTLTCIQSDMAVGRQSDEMHRNDIAALKKDVGALKVSKIKAATAMTVVASLGAGAYEGAGRLAAVVPKLFGG